MDSLSAYRPQRQRKSVNHYSDDNPNTFTVKVKRGDRVDNTHEIRSSQLAEVQSNRKGIKRPHAGFPGTKNSKIESNISKLNQSGDSDDDDNVIIASLVQQDVAAVSTSATPAAPRRGRPPKRIPPVTNKSNKRDSSSSSSSRSSSPRGTISSSAPRTKMTTKMSAPKKTPTSTTTASTSISILTVPNQIRRRKRVRILTKTSLLSASSSEVPQNEMISHPAAIRTVLPAHEVCANSIRKEPYEEYLSEIIAPRPTVSEWTRLEPNDESYFRPGKSSSSTNSSTRNSMTLLSRSSKMTPTITKIPLDVTATTVKTDVSITAFSRRQHPYSRQLQKKNVHTPGDNCRQINESDEWVVTGDCYGGVSLWKVGWGRQLCRLRTAASQREQSRVILSKKVISYPNEVLQTAWSFHDVILVLTDADLEGIKVSYNSSKLLDETSCGQTKSQQRLFLTDLTPSLGRKIQPSQQFHFNDYLPLVLWSSDEREIIGVANGTAEDEKSGSMASLLCLAFGNVENQGLISATVHPNEEPAFRCLAAIWDAHAGHQEDDNFDSMRCMLALAQTSTEKLELLRINQSKLDDSKTFVSGRTTISLITGRCLNVMQMECIVQQVSTSNQNYTLVCGTRIAIQILDSKTLRCLATFGKSVSLHGKIVQWQSCHWVRCPGRDFKSDSLHDSHGKVKQQVEWVQRHDEVATRMNLQANQSPPSQINKSCRTSFTSSVENNEPTFMSGEVTADDHCFWLVGVPHSEKGPSELSSTLHIWKNPLVGIEGNELDPVLGHQQVLLQQQVDSTSLLLPKGGSLGLCIAYDESDFRLLCATAKTGKLYQRIRAFRTNFAGVMYPVGYSVIDDNLEYIEDEAEMDQPIVIEEIKEEPIGLAVFPSIGPKPRGRPRKNQHPSTSINSLGEVDSLDTELQTALHISLHDAGMHGVTYAIPSEPSYDEVVDVLDHASTNDDVGRFRFQVPCWPTPLVLKPNGARMIMRSGSTDQSYQDLCLVQSYIDSRNVFDYEFLQIFPQKGFLSQIEQQENSTIMDMQHDNSNGLTSSLTCSDVYSVCSSSTGTGNNLNGGSYSNVNVNKTSKGKRTRTANVESIFQSSVDSSLRDYMSKERGRWSYGPLDLGTRYGQIFKKINRGQQVVSDIDECMSNCEDNLVASGDSVEEKQQLRVEIDVSLTMDRPQENQLSSISKVNANVVVGCRDSFVDVLLGQGASKISTSSANLSPTKNQDLDTVLQARGIVKSFDTKAIATNGLSGQSVIETTFDERDEDTKATLSTSLEMPVISSVAIRNEGIECVGSKQIDGTCTRQVTSQSGSEGNTSHNSVEKWRDSTLLPSSEPIVTPSDSSPINQVTMMNPHDNLIDCKSIIGMSARDPTRKEEKERINCAACRGRFVVHSCGKRDKPFDYEAVARAEREHNERMAAEKALAKAEKRRQADAKRREAKMVKKQEEEERKRLEEEELRCIKEAINRRHEDEERKKTKMREQMEKRLHTKEIPEHERYSSIAGWPPVVQHAISTTEATFQTGYAVSGDTRRPIEYSYTNRVPSYRSINGNSLRDLETPGSSVTHFGQGSMEVTQHQNTTASEEIPHRGMMSFSGNAIQPSTPIDRSDALAALAGLADRMPVAHDESYNGMALKERPLSNQEGPFVSEITRFAYVDSQRKYEYSGSLERQAAIHQALAETQAQDYETAYEPVYGDYYGDSTETGDQIVTQGYTYDNGSLGETYSGDAAEYGDAIIGSAARVSADHQTESYWTADLN
jgi:hypothetical protein